MGVGTPAQTEENAESVSVRKEASDQMESASGQYIQNDIPDKTENGFFEKIKRSIMSFLKLFSKNHN